MGEEYNNTEEMDFEAMMEQRMRTNFEGANQNADVSNERLKEMSKKLPSWSLEPPYSFLR